jgi:hypothetical protein
VYHHTGTFHYVTYDSPYCASKAIAVMHKKRLAIFLKEEKIRIKKQEKKFKDMIS